MNPLLNQLHSYPFEKLKQLFNGIIPPAHFTHISLGIGEPKHATPELIKQAIVTNLNSLANYPTTQGSVTLREAIASWISQRYGIPALNPATQILPVNGSREALFAFVQTIINTTRIPADSSSDNTRALVLCPNPFYQIYEGATYLAGAEPYFINADPNNNYSCNYADVPEHIWQRVQLVFVCSPGNPTGAILTLHDWKQLFELSDRYGFVIAADECYSEIYLRDSAPLGSLEAAYQLGRPDFSRLVSFASLSKRSNVPGLRSGFVAGDAAILKQFLLYRTYHGSAMSPLVQAASTVAWQDEQHVIENRALYKTKFAQVTPLLQQVLNVKLPEAGFYLWAGIDKTLGISDTDFAKHLFARYNVTVLPGSFLAREAHGINPGQQRLRMALVASLEECLEAAQRIVAYIKQLAN